MSDDMPADPWTSGGRYGAALDAARLLRVTLCELDDAGAVFAAVEALTEEELRMIAVELGLDSVWSRRGP